MLARRSDASLERLLTMHSPGKAAPGVTRHPFLSQQSFPRLWTLFQYLIGGLNDKRELFCNLTTGARNILEVGCSVGLLADPLKGKRGVNYTGIDIDQGAIDLAKKRHQSSPNVSFTCEHLVDFAAHARQMFDVAVFAAVLHHVDDDASCRMLDAVRQVVEAGGKIVAFDPLPPRESDGRFVRVFVRTFEQGAFLRTEESSARLVSRNGKYPLAATNVIPMHGTAFGFPVCEYLVSLEVRIPPAPRRTRPCGQGLPPTSPR